MFGKDEFDPNKDIPDLSGRVYVVTGGSAGIGYGITAHILQHNPARTYLLGKKEEHLSEAEEGLKKYGDTSRVEFVQVDFEDLQQTDAVAKKVASQLERLDALILNAGLGVGPYHLTKDGLDSHMQVNVIAQHHLAMILLPRLVATPDGRLCFQASESHHFGTSNVKFESLKEINTDAGPNTLYGRTKLALILLCRALHRRRQRNQNFQIADAYGKVGEMGVKAVRPFMKDPIDEGCRPMLSAATSDAVREEGMDGEYIVPDRKVDSVTKQAQDEE